jgi:hypothetical protein
MGTLHQIDPTEIRPDVLLKKAPEKTEDAPKEEPVKVSNNLPVDQTSTNLKTNQPFSKSYDPYINQLTEKSPH